MATERKKNSHIQIILTNLMTDLTKGNEKEGKTEGDFQVSDLGKVLDTRCNKRIEVKSLRFKMTKIRAK